MFTKRNSFLYFCTLFAVVCCIFACTHDTKEANAQSKIDIPIQYVPDQQDTVTLQEAFSYCDLNGFSKEVVILVNLAPHSGNYRLFAINLFTQDTLLKGLVAHGHCKSVEGRYADFSNEIGSNCSSLGRYRIGGNYQGSFGNSYKLIGLDSCNSNAEARYVVLHAHSCIPNQEQEDDICLSEGCPTVSPEVLAELESLIQRASQPVLLWIYN